MCPGRYIMPTRATVQEIPSPPFATIFSSSKASDEPRTSPEKALLPVPYSNRDKPLSSSTSYDSHRTAPHADNPNAIFKYPHPTYSIHHCIGTPSEVHRAPKPLKQKPCAIQAPCTQLLIPALLSYLTYLTTPSNIYCT